MSLTLSNQEDIKSLQCGLSGLADWLTETLRVLFMIYPASQASQASQAWKIELIVICLAAKLLRGDTNAM